MEHGGAVSDRALQASSSDDIELRQLVEQLPLARLEIGRGERNDVKAPRASVLSSWLALRSRPNSNDIQ
jgi:hypothetical protein